MATDFLKGELKGYALYIDSLRTDYEEYLTNGQLMLLEDTIDNLYKIAESLN